MPKKYKKFCSLQILLLLSISRSFQVFRNKRALLEKKKANCMYTVPHRGKNRSWVSRCLRKSTRSEVYGWVESVIKWAALLSADGDA